MDNGQSVRDRDHSDADHPRHFPFVQPGRPSGETESSCLSVATGGRRSDRHCVLRRVDDVFGGERFAGGRRNSGLEGAAGSRAGISDRPAGRRILPETSGENGGAGGGGVGRLFQRYPDGRPGRSSARRVAGVSADGFVAAGDQQRAEPDRRTGRLVRGDGTHVHPGAVHGGSAARQLSPGLCNAAAGRRAAGFSVLQRQPGHGFPGRFRGAIDRVSAGLLRHDLDPEIVHLAQHDGASTSSLHSAAG